MRTGCCSLHRDGVVAPSHLEVLPFLFQSANSCVISVFRSFLECTVHKVKVRRYLHYLPEYCAAERTLMTLDMGESLERCLKQMVEFEVAQ